MLNKICVLIGLFFVLSIPAYAECFDYRGFQEQAINQFDMNEYMANLNSKIRDRWSAPDVMEEGHVSVVFKIDKEGNVIFTEVSKSSGNLVFDESAVNTILKSAPFAPLPPESKREFLTLKYDFESSIVKTDAMKDYMEKSDRYFKIDNRTALKYIDLAIKEIEGDSACYFLYARRYKINKMLGDLEAAENDLAECKRLKNLYDIKRIKACKLQIQKENTPFSYFSLASAYDSAGDYPSAIEAIDKAISMTELNHAYKRYRAEIIMRSEN